VRSVPFFLDIVDLLFALFVKERPEAVYDLVRPGYL